MNPEDIILNLARSLGEKAAEEKASASEEELQSLFDYLDVDGSKTLESEELVSFLTRAGVVVTDEDVKKLARSLSEGESDSIPFESFFQLLTRSSFSQEHIEKVRTAFHTITRLSPYLSGEREGSLTADRLYSHLRFWGVMSEEEIKRVTPFFSMVKQRTVDTVYIDRFLDKLADDF
eukprot:gnl/Dysnectes_brevis/3576_a4547_1274.p1 GENE.gnl/Dysnectes_brevis/3576_a4547_1274~~gnl/Dysnectes_brevis/3576_a4547_1274.p1  ORF type:complete len:177 (-),score=29.41 gnl/Dysnectes_brevis/3576_a4547_1274:121-651(-)